MFYSSLKKQLDFLNENNSLRKLYEIKHKGKYIEFDNKKYLNISSNDYLGIQEIPELSEKFQEFITKNKYDYSFGAYSSRLLTGNHYYYTILENYLAQIYSKEASLVFNSGYHANIGILPAITKKNDLIVADKFVHASIIDGIVLSKAKHLRYKHNDYEHLEKILFDNKNKFQNIFIVTESIFSMDGDMSDLETLVKLKKKFNAYLYVDEAHAIGVTGTTGLGLSDKLNLSGEIDILVGTFGKAIASQGAFVVASEILTDYLKNTMRSLIYTTALPSVNILYTYFIMLEMKNMSKERNYLTEISDKLRVAIKNAGFRTAGNSQIVPMIIGDTQKCIEKSDFLKKNGFWSLPIRYPTVPKGTERLRFSLSAAMSVQDINRMIELLNN